jgi:hypothetical protein
MVRISVVFAVKIAVACILFSTSFGGCGVARSEELPFIQSDGKGNSPANHVSFVRPWLKKRGYMKDVFECHDIATADAATACAINKCSRVFGEETEDSRCREIFHCGKMGWVSVAGIDDESGTISGGYGFSCGQSTKADAEAAAIADCAAHTKNMAYWDKPPNKPWCPINKHLTAQIGRRR